MQNAEVRVRFRFLLSELLQNHSHENLVSCFLFLSKIFPADPLSFLQPVAAGQPEVPHAADDTATISASSPGSQVSSTVLSHFCDKRISSKHDQTS